MITPIFITIICFVAGFFVGTYLGNLKKFPGWTMNDQINFFIGLFK